MTAGPDPRDGREEAATAGHRRRGVLLAGRLLKWTLFAVVAVFVIRTLVERLGAVSWEDVRFDPLLLASAAACLVASLFLHVAALKLLVRAAGHPLGWRAVCSVWVAQLGKYVPGKAMTVVGAVWALTRNGVPPLVATGAVFRREGLVVVVGLMLAAPLTLWEPVRQALPLAWLWCGLLIAAGAVLLHPRVFAAVGNFLLRKIGRPPVGAPPRAGGYWVPALVVAAQWVLAGLSLWLLVRSLVPVDVAHVPLLISAAAMAGTFGFLAVFAPGGLGVREGILLVILSPVVGQGSAAVAVVAARGVQILVEAGLALAGFACLRYGDADQSSS